MSDRLFSNCCYGTKFQHRADEDCPCSPARFFKTPLRFVEPKNDSEGPMVLDADGKSVTMLFWPAHSPEDTEAAEQATYALGHAFAEAGSRASRTPIEAEPGEAEVDEGMIEAAFEATQAAYGLTNDQLRKIYRAMRAAAHRSTPNAATTGIPKQWPPHPAVAVDDDALVKRLRAMHRHNETMTFTDCDTINPDGPEAADRLQSLQASVRELEARDHTWCLQADEQAQRIQEMQASVRVKDEALRPFANFNLDGFDSTVLEVVNPWPENPAPRIEPIYVADFKRARAALSDQQGGE